MKASTAIKTFMDKGPCCSATTVYEPVKLQEIKDLKAACSPEEYQELGKQACQLLGVEYEE